MSILPRISDPHFGTEQPPVVEALATLAGQQRPDLLVLSGDITQRARPAQFRAARAFTDQATLASLLAEVDEPALQRKVLRLASAAAEADRHQADAEALVVAAARRHWQIGDQDQPTRSPKAALQPA